MNKETLEALEKLKGMEGMDALQGMNNAGGMNAMDMMSPEMMNGLAIGNQVGGVFQIVLYLLTSWGIYMLAKKMNLKRVWMSWIPFLQYYPMAQAGGKNVVTHFVYPILILIASFFVMGAAMALGGSIGSIIGIAVVVIATIYMIVKYIQVLSGISKKTGRGGWTTVGLFFVGFIMFPVVGYKYLKGENKVETEIGEIEEEVKVEL